MLLDLFSRIKGRISSIISIPKLLLIEIVPSGNKEEKVFLTVNSILVMPIKMNSRNKLSRPWSRPSDPTLHTVIILKVKSTLNT